MPGPASPHAAHDGLLVAAHAAGDATGADLERAAALVASCPECARLHRDLRALASALAAAPAPARPRDFRLTEAQAGALRRPRGWRRLLAPLSGARSAAGPLAASLAALGVAGLLLGAGLRLPLGAGTAALAPSPAGGTAETPGRGVALAGGPGDADATPGICESAPSFAPESPAAIGAHVAPSLAATPPPPEPTPTPRTPIDREQATAIASAARPDYAKERVLDVRLGAFAQLGVMGPAVKGPVPAPDDQVWLVSLGCILGPLDGQGVLVIIDATDGRVILAVDWIS